MHVEKNIRHSSVYRGCVKIGSMEANTKISMMAEDARKNKRQGREMLALIHRDINHFTGPH